MDNQTKGTQATNPSPAPLVSPRLKNYLEFHKPWKNVKEELLDVVQNYTQLSIIADHSDADEYVAEFLPSPEERLEDLAFMFDILRHS